VLYSSQDHLKIGTHDLDHHVTPTSLKHLALITFKHVFSQVKVISINRFASYSKHVKVLIQHLILSCLDYKVVNIILIHKINIMKVELLWNGSNKQELLISESVATIRTNLDLAR
jgi:hypothetical protein